MGLIHMTYLLLAIVFLNEINSTLCQCRKTRANAQVSALLKSLMSQGGGNGALQLLQSAAGRKGLVATEEVAVPRAVRPRSILPSAGVPNCGAPNVMLQNGVAPNILLQNGLSNIRLPNGLVSNIELQNAGRLIQNVQSIPQYVEYPVAMAPQLVPAPVQIQSVATMPVATVPMVEKCCPERLVNPFLPAASPVSAIAPTVSNILPPADIRNSRCNFLRKIPIPPPTL